MQKFQIEAIFIVMILTLFRKKKLDEFPKIKQKNIYPEKASKEACFFFCPIYNTIFLSFCASDLSSFRVQVVIENTSLLKFGPKTTFCLFRIIFVCPRNQLLKVLQGTTSFFYHSWLFRYFFHSYDVIFLRSSSESHGLQTYIELSEHDFKKNVSLQGPA